MSNLEDVTDLIGVSPTFPTTLTEKNDIPTFPEVQDNNNDGEEDDVNDDDGEDDANDDDEEDDVVEDDVVEDNVVDDNVVEDDDVDDNDVDDEDIDDDDDEDDEDDEDDDDDEEDEDKNNVIEVGDDDKDETQIGDVSTIIQSSFGSDNEDDDTDDEDEDYLQKLDKEVRENFLADYHPESHSHNYEEVKNLAKVTRNKDGQVIDLLHRTLPFLTKYEKNENFGSKGKANRYWSKIIYQS